MNKEIDYKKFEKELLLLYPHLSEQESEKIIKEEYDWEYRLIQ